MLEVYGAAGSSKSTAGSSKQHELLLSLQTRIEES
jgi:hypothetical protein